MIDNIPPGNDDVLFVELSQLTSVDAERWRQIRSLPWKLRLDALRLYADQYWADPATSAGERVMQILTILGIVGGAAGAISSIAALRGAI